MCICYARVRPVLRFIFHGAKRAERNFPGSFALIEPHIKLRHDS